MEVNLPYVIDHQPRYLMMRAHNSIVQVGMHYFSTVAPARALASTDQKIKKVLIHFTLLVLIRCARVLGQQQDYKLCKLQLKLLLLVTTYCYHY